MVHIEEATTRMAPATNFGDRTRFGVLFPMIQLTESRVPVGMQVASEWGEMQPAVLALTVGRVVVDHCGPCRPKVRPLIAQVYPEAASLGLAVARSQYLDGRVVAMDDAPRHDVLANLLG